MFAVEPQTVRVNRRILNLPALSVGPSTIAGAGFGLFAAQDIAPKQYITEYGGKLLSSEEGRALGAAGTHLMSLASHHHVLDGRVTDEFPLDYYTENHRVASFANTVRRNDARLNARPTVVHLRQPFVDPYNQIVTERAFLVATKPIAAGDEIFWYYGPEYERQFFFESVETTVKTLASGIRSIRISPIH